MWVSENSVGIDGFIRIARDAEPPLHGCSDLEIATLHVRPRHQGSGTGRVLLTTGLEFCAWTGRPMSGSASMPKTRVPQNFYVENGFTKIGETQFQIEDDLNESKFSPWSW
ncbi:GNAT family N-acetyltransferase [Phyllobacterium sp. A18/5-2]|uniref:GNAT family N-acetyltransferase n=1 Tax=Phyllobacterium sp. A18/5-2 TaxID=2978392 RepID=UPI003965A320